MRTLVCLSILVAVFSNIHDTFSTLMYPPFFENGESSRFEQSRNSRRHKRNKGDVETNKPLCIEDKLMQFLAEIQVINPESILKIATAEALSHMCRQVSDNIDKTEKYLATCKPPNQADLYTQLIRGVHSLHEMVCVNEEFHKRFETYHKCLKEMSAEFESCNGPADWNEDSEPAKICAAYKDIADCYYIKAAKVCGKKAAATMKELMVAIINSVITVKCNVKSTPHVSDAMPSAYIDKTKESDKNKLHNQKSKSSTTDMDMLLQLLVLLATFV